MARIYVDSDASLEPLLGKTIAVIGYGSQGRAWALNMRDQGLRVVVGVREGGSSWRRALSDGFKPRPISEAAREADVIAILVPDMVQPEVWSRHLEQYITAGKVVVFAHGFNVYYGLIRPPKGVDVVLVAPKAPGEMVRRMFVEGRGVPGLIAVYQDYSGMARDYALAIAKAIGLTRAGVIETTFAEETETDLIGEQVVLVGGLLELLMRGWELLVELGYQPEVAYFEVINEAKLIMDLIWRYGFTGMLERVSVTARYGGVIVGRRIYGEKLKELMREAALRVRSGEFTREWLEEWRKGMPTLSKALEEVRNHPVEEVGKKLRRMMGLEEE